MDANGIFWVLGAFGVLGLLIWIGAALTRNARPEVDPDDGPVYPGFGFKSNDGDSDPN